MGFSPSGYYSLFLTTVAKPMYLIGVFCVNIADDLTLAFSDMPTFDVCSTIDIGRRACGNCCDDRAKKITEPYRRTRNCYQLKVLAKIVPNVGDQISTHSYDSFNSNYSVRGPFPRSNPFTTMAAFSAPHQSCLRSGTGINYPKMPTSAIPAFQSLLLFLFRTHRLHQALLF